MSLSPFKRILRKCNSCTQSQLTFAPSNYASFNDFLAKPPPPQLSISDVSHQVITSNESFTFVRAINDKADAICQTLQNDEATGERIDNKCQTLTLEEEDTPLFQKNLRKVMDIGFIAAATNRD